jgi:hypothetical protein
VAPGQDLLITGRGFPAGSPARVELFSTPVLLGTTTADAVGNIRLVVTVPADTALGTHTVRVSVPGGTIAAETSISVAARLVTQVTPGSLSRTGADVRGPARLALGLVMGGFALVGLSWRERRSSWPGSLRRRT